MLGRGSVEPTHLLLALARRGNVESLLARRGVSASDIHAAIIRPDGLGRELVLGRVPRSEPTDAAIERGVAAAAARGILGPSSEDLLLGLADDPAASALLGEVGIEDAVALVGEVYPVRREPVPGELVQRYAERAAATRSPPQPGPIAPVFERFTREAHAAVIAADRSAEDVYVEPFHLLLGLLKVPAGVAWEALRDHEVTLEQAMARVGHRPRQSSFRRFPPRGDPPPPQDRIFGIPSDLTRRVLAEESLRRAYSRGDPQIGTGHLLLGLIDIEDKDVSAAVSGPAAAHSICATGS